MKLKKKQKNDRWIVVIPILFALFLLIGLIVLLNTSRNIRLYRSILCTLTSGSYEMTAEYDNVKVKVRPDNKEKLFNMFSGTKIWSGKDAPENSDVVHYYFKGDTDWTINIYEIDKEKVLIEVQGEKNYKVYAENNSRFEKYVKIGTPDGWSTLNIIIKNEE